MMKGVIVVTDSEAMQGFERALVEGGYGFTVIPTVWGRGRTGLKAGDRVHPGASSLLFAVVPEERLAETTALVKRVRDGEGVPLETRVFVLDVDEVA